MAIADPFDLLAGFPGWSTDFDLVYRQETSRQANGVTRVKDMGTPIWGATYQSRRLSPNELDLWRARLNALDGGVRRFLGYSLSRCRPTAQPGSGSLPVRTLNEIAANRRQIRLSGQSTVAVTAGDMIRIGTADLHRVIESASGNPTALFEVRPHIYPGVATGVGVSVVRPYCLMTVVPGSISSSADLSTGRGSISFQALEAR